MIDERLRYDIKNDDQLRTRIIQVCEIMRDIIEEVGEQNWEGVIGGLIIIDSALPDIELYTQLRQHKTIEDSTCKK